MMLNPIHLTFHPLILNTMKKFNQLLPGIMTLMDQGQKEEFCSHLRKLKFPNVKFNMGSFLSRDEPEYVGLDMPAMSFKSIRSTTEVKLITVPYSDFIDMLCGAYAGDLSEHEQRLKRFMNSNLLPGTGYLTESPEELQEMLRFMQDHGYLVGTSGANWEKFPGICLDKDLDVVGCKFEPNMLSRKEFEDTVMGKMPITVQALVAMVDNSRNSNLSNPLAAILGGMM